MEQTIDLIAVFDCLGFFGLIVGLISWQKKHGRLTEKRLTLIVCGYFSFFIITTLSLLVTVNFQATLLVEIILLSVIWGIGYPLGRWLYRQFNPKE
jgi:hypothetical protein